MSEGTSALMGNSGATPASAPQMTPAPELSNPTPWTSEFNPDTMAYIGKKGWQSPADLLESYRNIEKLHSGSNKIVEIPGDDADEAMWNKFYSRIGRPQDPSEYGIEGEMAEHYAKFAHELGLNKQQAKGLFERMNQVEEQKMAEYEASVEAESAQDMETLKREWGRKYDQNVASGQKAVKALGFNDESLHQIESKLGTYETMNLFSKIGSMMAEPEFIDGQTSDGFGQSSYAAKQQIEELKGDKEFMQRYLSGDPAANNKFRLLMERAHGN